MNIFHHELKAYRKPTLIWSLSLVLLMVFFMSMFPAFTKDTDDLLTLLESYPESVRKALGVSLESITSLLGFYSYVFTYVVLCGSIQAMNLGTSILSKEAREKTADFLLTKPVTRYQVVTTKLLAALASLVITNIIFVTAAAVTTSAVSETTYDIKAFLLISLTAFLVELMFLALGIFVSVTARKIKSVLPISLGTACGFFILGMLGSVIGEEAIRYLTPFKYYDAAYIIKHGGYEISFLMVEIIFIAAAILASYFIYAKKDIHAV